MSNWDFQQFYIIYVCRDGLLLCPTFSRGELSKILTQDHDPKLFQPCSIIFFHCRNCLGGPTLIKSPHEYSSKSLNCCLTSVHHSVPNQSLDILGINESINHVARAQAHSQLQSSCCRHDCYGVEWDIFRSGEYYATRSWSSWIELNWVECSLFAQLTAYFHATMAAKTA